MSDPGFNFGPSQDRREARTFEPPPWERDQFEQQQREREEREAAERAAREALLAQQEAASAEAAAAVAAEGGAGGAETGESSEATSGAAPAAEVDEKRVALMMLELRAEEPPGLEGAWAVNLSAGVVVGIVGFACGVWGALALTKGNLPPAGLLGGFVLVAFGLGFLGVGGWLVFKALRQRGVL